jgi:hypothetical protein
VTLLNSRDAYPANNVLLSTPVIVVGYNGWANRHR